MVQLAMLKYQTMPFSTVSDTVDSFVSMSYIVRSMFDQVSKAARLPDTYQSCEQSIGGGQPSERIGKDERSRAERGPP